MEIDLKINVYDMFKPNEMKRGVITLIKKEYTQYRSNQQSMLMKVSGV